MKSRVRGVAAGMLLVGSAILAAPAAHAGQVVDQQVTRAPAPPRPAVQMFDCQGSTGDRGCGAGFFWRDGWRGFGCYPC